MESHWGGVKEKVSGMRDEYKGMSLHLNFVKRILQNPSI